MSMDCVRELIVKWRGQAAEDDADGASDCALVIRECADDLEAALVRSPRAALNDADVALVVDLMDRYQMTEAFQARVKAALFPPREVKK